jgi:ABC-type oligopeptide transport system substrate-binding subunit
VDFPVFQERLRKGQFESYIGAWLDEPSPRGLADQWTSAGIGNLNYTGYRNAAFDSLFRRAETLRGSPEAVRGAWREAMDTLNADAPGLWLYTPMNAAGAARRVEGISINPYSWLSSLPTWRLAPP